MTSTDFTQPPGPDWQQQVLTGSAIEHTGQSWRFRNMPGEAGRYTDSQIDDYQGLKRRDFLWRPPLTMTVRARFSPDMFGTAGFGFWNDPFMMTGARMPALPRALWFFYASPPSNMKLARDVPGSGWKAATIDAIRLPFFLLAPFAPLAMPLLNIKPVYRALWPIGQRAIGVCEALVDASMNDWHTYRIEWTRAYARFYVDGALVLDCDAPPRGPLGFVLWIDNQAMIVDPRGKFGWQIIDLAHPQWMEIDQLHIERHP